MLERGVRFVQLWSGPAGATGNWDNHADVPKELPAIASTVDKPIAGLLKDLKSRGMLDDTLVLFSTEFGRQPFTQGSAGRDHNGGICVTWLAGAGVKGGTSHGEADEWGWRDRPALQLRLPRHGAPPARHRPRAAHVPPQRRQPPADGRARARDHAYIGLSGPPAMTYPYEPNLPGGHPSQPQPPPYGYFPQPPPPPPQRSGRRVMWILVGIGAVVVVLICAGVVGLAFFGMNVIETEVRNQVRDDPVLVEHIGQIESFDADLTESGAIEDEDTFVYRVKGTKGSGVLTVRHVTDDNGDEVVKSAKLRLPDGKVIELKSPSNSRRRARIRRSRNKTSPDQGCTR